jgi:hypothetical protein
MTRPAKLCVLTFSGILVCWGSSSAGSTPLDRAAVDRAAVDRDSATTDDGPLAVQSNAVSALALHNRHRHDSPPVVPANHAPPIIDADELAEDEAMRRADTIPEQRMWRASFASERQDDAWTKQVRDEVEAKSKSLLKGAVKLSGLSCRETVCRMHLQFADQIDAQDFIHAAHDPQLRYQYQSLDPEFDGAGFDRSDFTYEVLIRRAGPEQRALGSAARTQNTVGASSNDDAVQDVGLQTDENEIVLGPAAP